MTARPERVRRACALLLAACLGACTTAREAARDAGPADPPRLGPERAFGVANGYAGGAVEFRAKAWAESAEGYQRAFAFNPKDDAAAYLAAVAWARAGNAPAALEFLNEAWRLGSCLVPVGKSFAPIAGEPRLKEVEALLLANVPKVHASVPAFTLAERDLLPGSLAWDPAGKAFYVPSIRKRKIVRVSVPPAPAPPAASDFVVSGADGLDAVLAVKVDAARRRLWAVTAADPAMEGARPEDFGRSALVAYDLATGKLAGRWLAGSDPPHLFGDLALDAAGNVFVTDTASGEVHVLRAGAETLSVLARQGTFVAPKGVAVSPDGSRLYVADLARGVFRVDPKSGAASVLDQPAGAWPIALDALVLHGDSLVGVAGTVSRGRVGRWTLTKDGGAVRRAEILDCSHPAYRVPAGGTVADGALVYAANSQLDAAGPDGALPPAEELEDLVFLRLPLAR